MIPSIIDAVCLLADHFAGRFTGQFAGQFPESKAQNFLNFKKNASTLGPV